MLAVAVAVSVLRGVTRRDVPWWSRMLDDVRREGRGLWWGVDVRFMYKGIAAGRREEGQGRVRGMLD